MELWTALLIGFFGSLHCVGMCGPIALALPYHAKSPLETFWKSSVYNFGRIGGYAIIGILPGLLGQGLHIAGFQKGLSLALGVLLLGLVLSSLVIETLVNKFKAIRIFNEFIQHTLSRLIKALAIRDSSTPNFTETLKHYGTFFGVGVLNAFIPCGLVYMALAGAITQYSIWSGASYMAMFGLGTLPMMLILGLSSHLIGLKTRNLFKKLVPVFMLFFATLFIMRGLAIELPMDLQFWIDQGSQPMCH